MRDDDSFNVLFVIIGLSWLISLMLVLSALLWALT